jgi:hypothetical protein
VAAGGEQVRPHLTYLLGWQTSWGGPAGMLLRGSESSTLRCGLTLGHWYIHFSFRRSDHRLYSTRAREILRIPKLATRIHQICYEQTQPPRRPHGRAVPPTETVRACFRELFGEGSRHTPRDLTPTAHLLDAVMRRTLLHRGGYREGLTHIQLLLVHHLISQTPFDIWDVILSEVEDTLAEGFKCHCQLLYAH